MSVEVQIIPAADDQIRTEEPDFGQNVVHAICAVCYPEVRYMMVFGVEALCGRISNPEEGVTARCPDCVDKWNQLCPKGHSRF